jgi:hypothetical protein
MRLDNDSPCDFLAYLEWRLGQDTDATAKLLGEWLASYEPESTTSAHRIRRLVHLPAEPGAAARV